MSRLTHQLPRRVRNRHRHRQEADCAWGFGPGDRVYEAESAPPDDIAVVIKTEVSRLLDPDRLAAIQDADRTARDVFRSLAKAER